MIMKAKRRIAVVIPVFNDWDSLRLLLLDLASIQEGYDLEVIVVDDGSTANVHFQSDIDRQPFAASVVTLPQNVGHQHAIAIGLEHAAAQDGLDAIVIMDGDGEDRPGEIPALVEMLDSGLPGGRAPDVVVAKRGRRSEGLMFQLFYRLYRALFWILSGRKLQFGNFCALTPSAARQILSSESLRLHVSATILKSGLQIGARVVDRGSRYRGGSKMDLNSLTIHGLRSLAVFADTVLSRVMLISSAAVALSVLLIGLAIALKVAGLASPGWVTVVTGILLIIIAQSGTVAILALLVVVSGQARRGGVPPPRPEVERHPIGRPSGAHTTAPTSDRPDTGQEGVA